MSAEYPSRFTCQRCETSAPATRVRYDGLGYAICPGCGARECPGLDTVTDSSEAAGNLADVSPKTDGGRTRAVPSGFEWVAPE